MLFGNMMTKGKYGKFIGIFLIVVCIALALNQITKQMFQNVYKNIETDNFIIIEKAEVILEDILKKKIDLEFVRLNYRRNSTKGKPGIVFGEYEYKIQFTDNTILINWEKEEGSEIIIKTIKQDRKILFGGIKHD